MMSSRPWALAGVVAGIGGLAASYLTANLLTLRESPVVAVAELIIRLTPGPVAEKAIDLLGTKDKPFLLAGVVLALMGLFALAGWLWARSWWSSALLWVALALVGLGAVVRQRGAETADTIPVGVGLALWLLLMAGFAALLRRDAVRSRLAAATGPAAPTGFEVGPGARADAALAPKPGRRAFLLAAGAVTLVGVALGTMGRVVGNRKRAVQESRRLLRIPGVTDRDPGPGTDRAARGGAVAHQQRGLLPDRHHAAVPAINPSDWRLRIHGLVEREVVLTSRTCWTAGSSRRG